MPSFPTATATAIATTIWLITVPYEFFLSLVDLQYVTTAGLTNFESELALLYRQIQPYVRKTLATVETRI